MKNIKMFVEDLVKQDTIDIAMLSKAKFKHPIRHLIRFKYLTIKDKVEEIAWKIINFFK